MNKFIKNNWYYFLTAILVLLLFSLRFYHLTIIPVFADEAIYIRWAQVMRAEQTLRFLPLSDGKQPLFMWLIIPLFKFINDPLMAGRIVSILSGFGTMVGVGLLTYLLFNNKKAAIISTLIYSISPFTFFFDRLALADSLLSMFGVWTFIFAYIAIHKQRLDYAMVAGFALGGAWLTKSPALIFVLMLPTFWLFAPWKNNTKVNIFILLKSLLLSFVTILIGYGIYNILRLGPNFHLIASRNMDYVYPLSHIFERPLDPLITFTKASATWIVTLGPWSLLFFWLIGYWINWKKSWKQLLILSVWFLVPIIVQSEFAKTFTARYILFPIPYLIIIASSVFVTKTRWLSKVLIVILVIFISQAIIFDWHLLSSPQKANLPRVERSGYLEEWTAGQGIFETANYLIKRQAENPKEKIVIGTEGYFGTLPDGLQMYLNTYPAITAIGVGLNFDKVPSQLVGAKKAGDTTFLLVNESRFGNMDHAAKIGLTLIQSFPKAQKPDGTRDALLLFEVNNQTQPN